ncbi:MAG TPA: SDR family oxidoreductase [Solirubrobacteraceae bacterium]|nr:SDR family oxidoreductase [Solirubrobacteraceae bacterium]
MDNTPAPLAGQAALVTGASSGLGRATAQALARAGAAVALLARSAPELAAAADAVTAVGHHALPVPCDLADAGNLERAVVRVRRELGPVRVLVNAAATDAPGPVCDLTVDAWDRVLAVNLRAVFLLSRLVIPDMTEAGQGTIVNVSSVAGRRGWANASAYCASKFALTGFTQALGAELRQHGIRACVIYPGAMATHWGTFAGEDRSVGEREPRNPRAALPPEMVADFIAWIATAAPELVLDEATVTPLDEQGWP